MLQTIMFIICSFYNYVFFLRCRPVLKDLSRILILLNRPEDNIGLPPADWETLLAWGERVLRRYKKQNPNQVSTRNMYYVLVIVIVYIVLCIYIILYIYIIVRRKWSSLVLKSYDDHAVAEVSLIKICT